MNKEFKDDPRQVLEILNSLGIVNISAQELKTFLKELKLFRKIVKNCQLETSTKLLKDNTYIKNLLDHKSKLINTIIVHKQQCKQTEDENSKKNLKTTVNKVQRLIEKSTDPNKNTVFNKFNKFNVDNIKIKNVSSNNVPKKEITLISKSISTSKKKPEIGIFHKHLTNDPVILYNHYKTFWKQLSIPGENAHAKLRCAVRTRLFKSNSISKV